MGGSQGSSSSDGEVLVGLTDVILSNGPEASQCGRVFSQSASLRFYTQYAEYDRSIEFSNSEQSISRPALSVAQLLHKSIRSCMSRAPVSMKLDCSKTISARLLPSSRNVGLVAAAEVCPLVTVGSEATADDTTRAQRCRLLNYCTSLSDHACRAHLFH